MELTDRIAWGYMACFHAPRVIVRTFSKLIFFEMQQDLWATVCCVRIKHRRSYRCRKNSV